MKDELEKLGTNTDTHRGFPMVEFKDFYDHPCSIQASSIWLEDCLELAGTSALWIGPDSASPKIMASKAAEYGIATRETTGWVPYPIPDDVLLTTRMHLNREQVAGLIDRLQNWLDTGAF